MTGNKIDIIDLSKAYLNHFCENELSINHLKLQKLLYYTQAWHLVYFDQNPLFDDVPEAWVNGPVYRRVYDEYKGIGIYNNIDSPSLLSKDFKSVNFKALDLTEDQQMFINAVIKHYGTMSHDKLVLMTHSEKPWIDSRKESKPFDYSDEKISHKSMFDFYSAHK